MKIKNLFLVLLAIFICACGDSKKDFIKYYDKKCKKEAFYNPTPIPQRPEITLDAYCSCVSNVMAEIYGKNNIDKFMSTVYSIPRDTKEWADKQTNNLHLSMFEEWIEMDKKGIEIFAKAVNDCLRKNN